MVSDTTALILLTSQFTSAALTLLILLRIIYVLSANPIGEFTQELMYLRAPDLRRAGVLVFLVIIIELFSLLYPFTVRQGWLRDYPDINLFATTAQGLIILSAAVTILLVVRRYTHRALDRRIRESMETLAYLEGQRRRRKAVESGTWQEPVDEE
ncbi:MAG: hypothetical protein WDA16_08250 [Candidatus Thermoplasmatota archaeon]